MILIWLLVRHYRLPMFLRKSRVSTHAYFLRKILKTATPTEIGLNQAPRKSSYPPVLGELEDLEL